MAMNRDEIVSGIASALKGELKSGWNTVRSLVQEQSEAIATQTVMVTKERVSGSLRDNDQLYHFFMKQLEKHAQNLAFSVANLTILTAEKAWNAIVDVIWGEINKALAAAGMGKLPMPAFG